MLMAIGPRFSRSEAQSIECSTTRSSSAAAGADLDWDAALEGVGADAGLLLRMAGIFLAELTGMTQAARDAIADHDARGLEQAAHRLRGSVGHFGAQAAFAAAERLEEAGATGDLDGVDDMLRALETALDAARAELERRVARGAS